MSIPGAVVAAIILGLVESLGSIYISVAYRDVFAFMVLIGVLMFPALRAVRPEGAPGMTRFEKTVCGVALAGGLVIPFLLDHYTIRVAAMALYYIVLASSWNLLLGYAGQLSFAHAAFAGIGAYTSGLLSFHYGVHPGFGVFIGGAVAAGIGWCLGRMCLRTRGPYLALMTPGLLRDGAADSSDRARLHPRVTRAPAPLPVRRGPAPAHPRVLRHARRSRCLPSWCSTGW